MNRTALHYAYGISDAEKRDAIVKILVDAQSDQEAADCRGKKPAEFTELTDEISAMIEAEPAAEAAAKPAAEPAAEPSAEPAAEQSSEQPADAPPAATEEPAAE